MAVGKYKVELTKRYSALSQNVVFDTGAGSSAKVAKEIGSKLPGAIASKAISDVVQKSALRKFSGDVYEDDPNRPTQKSLMGTPQFDYITVKMGESIYHLPNDPLLEWEFLYDHDITKQTIDEVVETSAFTPISFRLQGFLWDASGHYPESQLKDFLSVWRKSAVWEVSGRLFNLLDVKCILVERAGFTAEKGFEDTQYFEIYCRSYNPVELEILA